MKLLLLVLALPLTTANHPMKGALPWDLDRSYVFDWSIQKKKIGEIVFKFSKVKDSRPARWVLSARRKTTWNSRSFRSSGHLEFFRDGSPAEYREETFASQMKKTSLQDWSIRFSGQKVTSICVNGGKKERASEKILDAPKGTMLFAHGAIEHWALLALRLRDAEKTRRLPVFYPSFGKVIEIEFVPGKERESIEIGKQTILTRRFDFRYVTFGEKGSIWIDAEGRLLRYRSGQALVSLTKLPK